MQLIPARLHLWLVTLRWALSSAYVALRHAFATMATPGLASNPGALPGPRRLGSLATNAITNRCA